MASDEAIQLSLDYLNSKRVHDKLVNALSDNNISEILDLVQDGYIQGRADALRWIPVSERLPESDEYVAIYLPNMPWVSSSSKGKHFVVVAQFIKGEEFPGSITRFADKHGNNLVPYRWKPFGSGDFFGQEPTHWLPIKLPTEAK